jgi:hypothetical protein
MLAAISLILSKPLTVLEPMHCERNITRNSDIGYVEQCFSNFVRPRPVNPFFSIRRGPGLNKFTRKYFSNFDIYMSKGYFIIV